MKRAKSGFSLVELSVAVMVLSVVIVGVLSVATSRGSNDKIKLTNDRIAIIYKALGDYVLVNKRLPCPASIKAIKTSDTTYGNEGTAAGTCTAGSGVYLSTVSGATNLVYGMVPVKTLGLSSDMAEDGFGSKIAYIIDKTYTSSTTFTSSGGNIIIQKYAAGALSTVSSNAIFALISYGPNKNSAFNSNSNSQNTATTDADEMANDAISFDDSAKTAAFTQNLINISERSTSFDDIVFYKSRDNFLMDARGLSLTNPNITSNASHLDCDLTSITGTTSSSIDSCSSAGADQRGYVNFAWFLVANGFSLTHGSSHSYLCKDSVRCDPSSGDNYWACTTGTITITCYDGVASVTTALALNRDSSACSGSYDGISFSTSSDCDPYNHY
jgi:prepilin-type N-terminal cleavage/methylation domain-containing protein